MLITCPSCAAEYNVPGMLAPGRVVRCARCGGQWAPVAAHPPAPVIEAVAEPITPAVVKPPAAQPVATLRVAPPIITQAMTPVATPATNRTALLLAWVGSVILIAALLGAAFVQREPIMRAWPPSMRLYAALGLTAPP